MFASILHEHNIFSKEKSYESFLLVSGFSVSDAERSAGTIKPHKRRCIL